MRIDTRTVVDLLQRLERQDAEHRPHLADAASAINRCNFERAVEATGKLYSALESIIVTRSRLREYVVSVDGLGEPGSLIELAIRARRVVIGMQVGRLRDAFGVPGVAERSRGWFVGRFSDVGQVFSYLEELAKGSGIWERYREGQPQPAGVKEADRATMYRTTVRIEQRTIRERGADPALLHFLRKGIAATDWIEVHTGCGQVASALAGEIDMESDIGVVVQLPEARISNANSGSP